MQREEGHAQGTRGCHLITLRGLSAQERIKTKMEKALRVQGLPTEKRKIEGGERERERRGEEERRDEWREHGTRGGERRGEERVVEERGREERRGGERRGEERRGEHGRKGRVSFMHWRSEKETADARVVREEFSACL